MTSGNRTPTGAGVGLRLPHLAEVVATRPPAAWLEIHPENFLANPHATELLTEIASFYPISVHTVGVSIGSATGLDRHHLARVRRLIDLVDPILVSGHLAWSTHEGEYLNDPCRCPTTRKPSPCSCSTSPRSRRGSGALTSWRIRRPMSGSGRRR